MQKRHGSQPRDLSTDDSAVSGSQVTCAIEQNAKQRFFSFLQNEHQRTTPYVLALLTDRGGNLFTACHVGF